jgi:hypothetical protein
MQFPNTASDSVLGGCRIDVFRAVWCFGIRLDGIAAMVSLCFVMCYVSLNELVELSMAVRTSISADPSTC